MKRIAHALIAAFIVAAFALPASGAAAADSPPIRTVVNGREVRFDVPPVIENDRTLVPMRGILEALGATIEWNPAERSVTARHDATELRVVLDVKAAVVNGSIVPLEVPPRIVDGRTMVPLRFVAESLGAKVGWDPLGRSVSIDLRTEGVASRAGGARERQAQAMVEAASAQIGAPYAWGGSSPRTGFDCSGFMLWVARQVGIDLPRTSQEQFDFGIPVDRANLLPGDLVFFSTYAPGASHVGVYDGKGSFIHAGSEGKGVQITPMSRVYWAERYVGARRILR